MKRRTFLTSSAIGVGSLAGIYKNLKAAAASPQSAWGTNAVVLKSPWSSPPSIDAFLADREHTIALDRFYRVGGLVRPITPTECRIAYTEDALLVAFRCTEPDMSFPVGLLKEDWYALAGLPCGSDSWPPLPDEVDILLQPDAAKPAYYQFAVTPEEVKYGCQRVLRNPERPPDSSSRNSMEVNRIETFDVTVARKANEWIALFQIPWATLGGKPQSHFGFLPMRTRWRDTEFISPVAMDFHECLPVDLLIETHFSGEAQAQDPPASLCRLPSGAARWQRPSMLSYPDLAAAERVWRMQSSLSTPTDMKNLGERLSLTQSWIDLMTLEGFLFVPATGSIIPEDMTPANFRQMVNAALRSSDPSSACQLLDAYLHKLDLTSRDWFADGSAGNVRRDEWKPVTSLDSLEVKDDVLRMRGVAGGHSVALSLSMPKTGGVRIYTAEEGHHKPDGLSPLKVSQSPDSCALQTPDGKVVIRKKPFSVSFYNAAGTAVITEIGAGNLAFRFDSDGRILATDFKNRLGSSESIYGFGEKYDHFNKRGVVLTLWGMDDWLGNGMGLRNTTYKGLAIFHSSKGYMAFGNSSYRLRADVGKTNPSQYRISQHGPIFDYYFWIGAPEKAIQSYTGLTGKPMLPPKWAFQEWMGRGGSAWASGPLHNAVAEEESVTRRFAELDIPHSAIYAEGASAFNASLNEFMAPRNIEVLGYFMCATIREAQQRTLLPDVPPDQLPVMHTGNESEARSLNYIDFTNPHALELCKRWWKPHLDLGVAGSMVDFGDRTPEDAIFYNGQRGAEMHNYYYYDYQKTISEVFHDKRGDDFILYGRGAAPGTQKWVGQFAGDHGSNFDGLRAVMTGILNLSSCGYSNWGSDLGGYFGVPEPAVYIRWTQFGLFSPLMRWHGKAAREPWDYGDAAVENYKFCAWARENLVDYIYGAAISAHQTGVSIIRAMPVAFPREEALAPVNDQFMFGEDLLVAPVVDEHNSRTILFPPGQWTGLWDGKTVSGPARVEKSVPLNAIPAYLRSGAVVPVQLSQDLQFGKSMTPGRVNALVVTRPRANAVRSRINARSEAAKVTVQATARGSSWKLENLPETSYLLVYGSTAAAAVRVDGQNLPKLADAQTNSAAGWNADRAGSRLVIHLPAAPAGASRKIEVDFVPDEASARK